MNTSIIGKSVNCIDSFSNYLISTIMDIPEETVIKILEVADPLGLVGARGVGEMPYMPFAPAVATARNRCLV